MKFDVLNRLTDKVQFTAEIDCDVSLSPRLKLGMAVMWACKNDANLRGADLRGAYLSGADLSGANLSDANLSDAYLRGADLSGADFRGAVLRDANIRGADLSDAVLRGADLRGAVLRDANIRGADLSDAVLRGAAARSFKADLWMTLSENSKEVPAMLDALRDGKVNGSTYSGECACLVGTIANIRGVGVDSLPRNPANPAEQWFLMIGEGDTPDKDTGGGYAARMALAWGEEWCALHGVAVTAKRIA